MQSRRRLFSFLLLNAIVSIATTLVVLNVWAARYFTAPAATTSSGINLSGGEATPTNADDETLAIPAALTAGQLEIRRIVGAGDMESERIEILHVGDREIPLEGWSLVDEQGNRYTFPNLKLAPQGSVTVYTKSGLDIVVELYWGLDAPVWESGEVATLVDPSGTAQATYTVP